MHSGGGDLQNIKGEYQKRGRKPLKSHPSHHLPFPSFLHSTADTFPGLALLVTIAHQNIMGNSWKRGEKGLEDQFYIFCNL